MTKRGYTFLAFVIIFGVSIVTILATSVYYFGLMVFSRPTAIMTAICWWLWLMINWIAVVWPRDVEFDEDVRGILDD